MKALRFTVNLAAFFLVCVEAHADAVLLPAALSLFAGPLGGVFSFQALFTAVQIAFSPAATKISQRPLE
jgi:hypothetical protein